MSAAPRAVQGRPAYTLLEVMLATAIGVLLLAALYVALDVQLGSAQAGRDLIERTTVARSILARMGADITPSLGNIDPARYRSKGAASSSTAAPSTTGTPSSTGTTGTTGSTSGTGTASTSGATTGSSTTTTDQASTALSSSVRFDQGVIGDATSLTLYHSRVPREAYSSASDDLPGARTPVSDLRRVTWWLAGDGDSPLGLARQEVKVATSDDATGPRPPDIADEASFVEAPQVRDLRFSYFDGTAWQDSWDGTVAGSDGVTPIGPPRAIAIVLGIIKPGSSELQYYRHVVVVPVANGTEVQPQSTETTP
jgi:hypothetical protein